MPFPDHPSHEPIADILAQLLDSADRGTKRTGVLVPHGNPSSPLLDAAIKSAQSSGRALPVETGVLVLNTPKAAQSAHFALSSGIPSQKVIGMVTGAGEGKSSDQTAVVQGTTPAGAVVSESMVRPHEVPAKIEEVGREGKTAVVTTPEAAISRRLSLLMTEKLRNRN